MALPQLDFLPTAVAEHLDLVEAIKNGDADRAEQIMHNHVQGFYARVKEVLQAKT
jgi:DNA-binding GntR family transcriptional regulator